MPQPVTFPPVLLGLAILLSLQLLGTAVVTLLRLPLPGAVVGLVLLLGLGAWRGTRSLPRLAEPAGRPLLAHLQLLFVPPGAGALLEISRLAQNALPLALAVGGSFVVALLVTGRLLQALLRHTQPERA